MQMGGWIVWGLVAFLLEIPIIEGVAALKVLLFIGSATGAAYGINEAITAGNSKAEKEERSKIIGDAHKAAKARGDRTSPDYGGNCTANQFNKLYDNQKKACKEAEGISCNNRQTKYNPNLTAYHIRMACFEAQKKVVNTCFAGGDSGHKIQVMEMLNGAKNCIAKS